MVRPAEVTDSVAGIDQQSVWQEITRIARAALRDAAADTDLPPSRLKARIRVESDAGPAWDVRAQPLLHAGDGPPLIVVAVERIPDTLPTVDQVQERFGLSHRQAQVAVLLARRLTTKEIAARLRIARNTARRHVELVLLRLRLHSRMDVAALLSDAAAAPVPAHAQAPDEVRAAR